MSSIEIFISNLIADEDAPEVVTDEKSLSAYIAQNYSRVPVSEPKAIVYPTTTEQVVKIVELANANSVSLVVRSSQGLESLNGSSLPSEGKECVAVNLSKMNKIKHIDAKNRVVIVEAGVTYGQLNEALKPYGLFVEHPLSPRKEKSIVASLLDREPVMTAKHVWDVPDPLCCVEMVMGNGTLFRTGSAAGPGSIDEMIESGVSFSQSQGPVWLDLGRAITGSQGTLAIVTWASVKVRMIGSVCTMVYAQSDDINQLAEYASQVIRRRLGEEAVLLNRKGMEQVFKMNKANCLAMPEWTFITSVRGFNFFPEKYMNNQILDMEDVVANYNVRLKKELPGISNEEVRVVLENASPEDDHWRWRNSKECLDMFCLSNMDKIDLYTSFAKNAAQSCGINADELIVYAQPSQMGRNCQIEFIVPASVEKADEMEMMLGITLLENQAFFSRPYGKLTESVYDRYHDQKKFMPLFKSFFDENFILNPGRLVYEGSEE